MASMTMNYELITPEKAKDFLATMVNNRNLSKATVKGYVTDMICGNWDEKVGSAISFDEDGHLIDGQHRLAAICASGISLKMWVFRGGSPKAIYDSNRKRSNSDQIAILREDFDVVYRRNNTHAVIRRLIEDSTGQGWQRVTAKEIIDFIEDNKELLDGFFPRMPRTMLKHITIATVYYAMFLAYCNGVDIGKILEFMDILCTGKNASEDGYPVIAYRNWLLEHSAYLIHKRQDVWRCQWALKQYVSGKKTFMTKEPKDFVYPIPDLKIRRREA